MERKGHKVRGIALFEALLLLGLASGLGMLVFHVIQKGLLEATTCFIAQLVGDESPRPRACESGEPGRSLAAGIQPTAPLIRIEQTQGAPVAFSELTTPQVNQKNKQDRLDVLPGRVDRVGESASSIEIMVDLLLENVPPPKADAGVPGSVVQRQTDNTDWYRALEASLWRIHDLFRGASDQELSSIIGLLEQRGVLGDVVAMSTRYHAARTSWDRRAALGTRLERKTYGDSRSREAARRVFMREAPPPAFSPALAQRLTTDGVAALANAFHYASQIEERAATKHLAVALKPFSDGYPLGLSDALQTPDYGNDIEQMLTQHVDHCQPPATCLLELAGRLLPHLEKNLVYPATASVSELLPGVSPHDPNITRRGGDRRGWALAYALSKIPDKDSATLVSFFGSMTPKQAERFMNAHFRSTRVTRPRGWVESLARRWFSTSNADEFKVESDLLPETQRKASLPSMQYPQRAL